MVSAARSDTQPGSVAEAYLRRLRDAGIEKLYVNGGTDFAPLIEAYARMDALELDVFPQPVVAAHENLAMGMAHGAYLVTGKPQAVMFHVNVGTANAACAAINAAAERVPLLITAGRTPILEEGRLGARNVRVSWAQEMYDQAALVREAVKWDYELRDPAQVDAVVDRALTMAVTEPRGPVYLTLPREVLAASAAESPLAAGRPATVVPTAAYPDPAAVEILADRLAAARFPIISSMASGADPATVPLLAELCERFAIGYVEEQARYLNLPHDHPCHLGFAMAPALGEADVLCCLESDVPWVPEFGRPDAAAFVAQCGLDPNFSAYPMRGHRSDLSITSAIKPLLEALLAAMAARAHRVDPARHERLLDRARAGRERRRDMTNAEWEAEGPITPLYLSAVLGDVLHENCTLFNEYYAAPLNFHLRRPGTYFYLPASGGLGWALPAAIGAKLEDPERTCIAAVGDGTYFFSNPAACHHASRKHEAPVLTVICNNARWNAVDATARLVYPQGHLTSQASIALSDLAPSADLAQYVQASGGYGETVSERGELAPALQRALRAVEAEGRQAVLDVRCS